MSRIWHILLASSLSYNHEWNQDLLSNRSWACGILRSSNAGNSANVLARLSSHSKAVHAVLPVGLARGHYGKPAAALELKNFMGFLSFSVVLQPLCYQKLKKAPLTTTSKLVWRDSNDSKRQLHLLLSPFWLDPSQLQHYYTSDNFLFLAWSQGLAQITSCTRWSCRFSLLKRSVNILGL